MIKWAEIAASCHRERYDFLSSYLNENGVKNSIDYIEVMPSEYEAEINKALETYDIIRIGSPYLDDIPLSQKQLPLQVATLGAADAMIKKASYPVSGYYQTCRRNEKH